MVKRILRFIITVWGIIALFPLGSILYAQYDLYHGPLADSNVVMVTWLDRNANGVHEEGEPPLANVCVGFLYRPNDLLDYARSQHCDFQTDETGTWSEFMAGEDCSGGIYVYALPPQGYQPTTDMARESCEGEFGFVEKDAKVTQHIVTAEDFARREVRNTWIWNLLVGSFIFLIALTITMWLEDRK
jgi:hypothetical protein